MSRGLTLRRLEQARFSTSASTAWNQAAVEKGTIEELAEELADALGAEPSGLLAN
jgi:hypothetical protein